MVYDPRCWMPGDGSLSTWLANAGGRPSAPTAPSGLIELHIGANLGRVRDHTAVAVSEVKLSRDYTQHYL